MKPSLLFRPDFSVSTLFNPAACLVTAHLPDEMGGDVAVDLVSHADMDRARCTAGDVAMAFCRAAQMTPIEPYRMGKKATGQKSTGWRVHFMREDPHSGALTTTSRLYLPERDLSGTTARDAWMDWVCWRARVMLHISRTPQKPDAALIRAAEQAMEPTLAA